MKYSVIILAAGMGSRMNLGYNKMFVKIDGQTVIEKTIHIFDLDQDFDDIIIVVNEKEKANYDYLKHNPRYQIVAGGSERQYSVYNGLKHVKNDFVFIHDGARCFLSQKELEDLKTGLNSHDALLVACPVKDTIKEVRDGKVVKTLVRADLMQAATPQVFKTSLIKQAHQTALDYEYLGTDDCDLVEKFSETSVHVVIGSYDNKKITTIEDIK